MNGVYNQPRGKPAPERLHGVWRNLGPAGAVPAARRLARSASQKTDNAVSVWTVLAGTRDAKMAPAVDSIEGFGHFARVEHAVISVLRISIEATTDHRKFKLAGRNERAKMFWSRESGEIHIIA